MNGKENYVPGRFLRRQERRKIQATCALRKLIPGGIVRPRTSEKVKGKKYTYTILSKLVRGKKA